MDLINKLKSPPKENKSIPFWSINDKLEPEMLRKQIDEMKRMNMGGYFFHARAGYKGDYLGEDWMASARVAVEHGCETGMDAWMYDEAGWPSGSAGGLVNSLGDKFHIRWLKPLRQQKAQIDRSKVVGIFQRNAENRYIRINFDSLDDAGEYNVIYNMSSGSYVDVFNPEVTAKFIEATHQKYYDIFSDEIGKTIPGFFTDEPRYARSYTPWSYLFPKAFRKAYDYDLLDNLMALFEEYEGAEKTRYDFYAMVHKLFVESYMKQIYEWCDAHNCKLTGHILVEDSIAMNMEAVGGAMQFYEYMHVPGVDWLGRRTAPTVMCKQLQSVACQLGKSQTLSEMFGCSGWNVSFDELKWIAETQYVNGINLMCQHLESYSLRGQRKRDFPPSLYYQQSWWDLYPQFNEYFNRLSVLLTAGKQGVDVLVIHPLHTGWMLYSSEHNEATKEFSGTFDEICEKLSGHQVDYHLGDENLLAKYAKIDGEKISVGKYDYKAVVMPQMHTIDESTFKLLTDFVESGGKIVSFKTFPTRINAVYDERLSLLKRKVTCFDDYEALITCIKGISYHYMSITANGENADEIRYMMRELGDGQDAYYILNKDPNTGYETVISFRGKKDIKLLDLATLEVKSLPIVDNAAGCEVKLNFKPMQSCVLLCDYKVKTQKDEQQARVKVIKPDYSKNWKVDNAGLNSLTVDYCCYKKDKGEWSEPVQTHLLFQQLLKCKRSAYIDLKMSFTMDIDPSRLSCLYLVCEDPQKWEISVNANKVEYSGEGFWKDSAFSKIDMKEYAKKGENELLLSGNFYQNQKIYDILSGDNMIRSELNRISYDTELESIYILGDFGVKSLSDYHEAERNAVITEGPFVITEAPKEVKTGDITTQGFCFFGEAIQLSQKFRIDKCGAKVLLDINTPYAPAAEVYINGEFAGNAFWIYEPLDITKLVKDGENTLAIKLYSSNRNLLGPHHHIDGELYSVSPYSYVDIRYWFDNANMWTDRYSFVKFGINGN